MARAARRDLGRRIGVDLERPEQWTQPQVWLQEMMTGPPYTDALTERFHTAVDQLAHPLLFHSSNPNHGTRPRVMAQPAFSGSQPHRTGGDGLYPVEIPVARARP